MSDSLSTLADVGVLAQHLVAADRRVEEVEAQLAVVKEDARRLREESLPAAMEELGLTELVLSDGAKITTGLEVYCGITEATRSAAHEWLDTHGFGGLIKTEVTVPFGRDARTELAQFHEWLTDNEVGFSTKQAVHPGTLKAWLKEQLREEACAVPLQLFGARPVTVAKVKLPKG